MSEEIKNDCYPIYCSSLPFYDDDGEDSEIWESFNDNLKDALKWIRGFPYWRVPPQLDKKHDFDLDREVRVIRSRITFTEHEVPDMRTVKILNDYSQEWQDYDSKMTKMSKVIGFK